jgi:hypothetical protein
MNALVYQSPYAYPDINESIKKQDLLAELSSSKDISCALTVTARSIHTSAQYQWHYTSVLNNFRLHYQNYQEKLTCNEISSPYNRAFSRYSVSHFDVQHTRERFFKFFETVAAEHEALILRQLADVFKEVSSHHFEDSELDETSKGEVHSQIKSSPATSFIETVDSTNWETKSAAEIHHAIDQALSLDLPLVARRLAELGRTVFPEDENITTVARILAPPVVRVSSRPNNPSQPTISEWITKHADEFRGQWIGFRNNKFIGAASSRALLISTYRLNMDDVNIVVMRVP